MENLVVEEVEDQHEAASLPRSGGHDVSPSVGLFDIVGSDAMVTQKIHEQSQPSQIPPASQRNVDMAHTQPFSVDSTKTEIGNELHDERKEEAVLEFLDKLDQQSTPLCTPSDGTTTPGKYLGEERQYTPFDEKLVSMQEVDECEGIQSQTEEIANATAEVSTTEQHQEVKRQENELEDSLNELRRVPPKSAALLVERCFQLPPSQFKSLYADPRPRHFISPKNMPPSPFAALRDIFEQREALDEERKKLRSATMGRLSPPRTITTLREELRAFLESSEWHKDEIKRRLLSSHAELSLSLTEEKAFQKRILRSASTDPTLIRDPEHKQSAELRSPSALPALSPTSKGSQMLSESDLPIRAQSTDPVLCRGADTKLPDISRPHQTLPHIVRSPAEKRTAQTAARKRLRTSPAREGKADNGSAGWETKGRECGERQPTNTVKILIKHLAAWRGGFIPPALEQAMLKLFVLYPGDVWEVGGYTMPEEEAELERRKGRTKDVALLGMMLGMKIVGEVPPETHHDESEDHAEEDEAEAEAEDKVASKLITRERAASVLKSIKAARKTGVNPSQPADSVGWDDFCTFLRKTARLASAFVPHIKVAEKPQDSGADEHKPAVVADGEEENAQGATTEEGKGHARHRRRSSVQSVQDRHGNRMSTEGQSEYHPTAAEFEEVKQLFRWFQSASDVEYCDIPALGYALYMNGFSHRAVSSLIHEAKEVARKYADTEKRDKIARIDFAVILAKFRRQTEPARSIPVGLSNMVRVIVVQGGSNEATAPALKVLGNRVIPYLVDLAVEMGGILEFESVQLADYTHLIRQNQRRDAEFTIDETLARQESVESMHTAMTASELIAYASGECRAACKHVWFLFLIDQHITTPCLPEICSEGEFEAIETAVRARGLDVELLRKCYELETCLVPEQYRLVIDDISVLKDLKELHDSLFAGSQDWQAEKHLWKPTPAYRVLTEAFDMAPVFVMVREDCLDGVYDTKSPEMVKLDKQVLTRVQEHSLLWYRLGPDVKRRNRKLEEQSHVLSTKIRKVGRRIAMLGSLSPRLGSPVEGLPTASKPSSAESSEASKLTPFGKSRMSMLDLKKPLSSPGKAKPPKSPEKEVSPDTLAKWAEMLEHDVYHSMSSLVASTMSDMETFNEQKIHETYMKRILFLVEGARQSVIHPTQDDVVRSLVDYLTHTVDDMHKKEAVASIPLKLESRVQEGLRCMRNAAEHRAQYWSFPSEETDFQIILDPALAQETMLGHSMAVKQQASGVMKQEWQSMTWPERLAVVQVVAEYQRLLATLDSLKPTTPTVEVKRIRKNSPAFIIGSPGSGRSAALAMALKSSVTTANFMTSAEVEIAPAADGQVSGVCFLRAIGASTKAMDGRSLLRSLVLQIREHMEPDKHLQESIPGALVQLEDELLHSLPMATANCPLVIVVDGLDKLAADDPILTLRWLPEKLPANVRVVITATEGLMSSGACSKFDITNVLRIENPTHTAASAYIKDFFALSDRQPEPEDVASIMHVFSIAPSLHVLSLCCQYAKQWSSVPRLRAAHPRYRSLPLFASDWDNLEFNPEYFSSTAMGLLSMLVLARHGLSELHMRLAIALLNSHAEHGLASPIAVTPLGRPFGFGRTVSSNSGHSDTSKLPDMLKTWDIKASADMAALRWLVKPTVAGKSSLVQLIDPMVANAVRNSDYFQTHKREICEALISVISSPESARSIPVYQQVASLPALQMQLAATVGILPVEGHGGVGWTLLSTVFIRTKIEAGLLEDLIRDFQDCLQGSQSGLFALAEETIAVLCQRLQSINYNLDWFVKPFHWGTLEQLIKREDGTGDSKSSQPLTELEAMWSKFDDEEEETTIKFIEQPRPAPRVQCTLRLPHRKMICSCDVFSSASCVRYAVGFEDGQVMVWDGIFGEVDRVLETGNTEKVLSVKFVQGPFGRASANNWKGSTEMVPQFLVCATVGGKVVGFSHGAWKHDFSFTMQFRKLGAKARFADSEPEPDAAKSRFERTSTSGSPLAQDASSPLATAPEEVSPTELASPPAHTRAARRGSAVPLFLAAGSVADLSSTRRRGSSYVPTEADLVNRTASQNRRGSAALVADETAEVDSPSRKKKLFPPAGLNALTALRRPSNPDVTPLASEVAAPLTCLSTSCIFNDNFLIAAGAQDGDIQIWFYKEETTPEGVLKRSCTCADIQRFHTASVNCIAFAPNRWWMVSASSDKTIRLWDCNRETGLLSCVEVLEQGSACFWCDFDGNKLLCSGFGFIRQFDVKSLGDDDGDSDWEFDLNDNGMETKKMSVFPRGSVHFGGPAKAARPKAIPPMQRMNSVLGKSLNIPRTESNPPPEQPPKPERNQSSNERVLLTVRASKLDNCVRMVNGDLMMVCCDDTMMVWDLESDNAQSLELSTRTACCAGSKDGKIVLVASQDHNLRAWEINEQPSRPLDPGWARRRTSSVIQEALKRQDSTTLKRRQALKAPRRGSVDVQVDVSPEDVHRLKMPQVATGLIKSEASINTPVASVSISHDGLIALSVGEGKVELWDVQTGAPTGTLGIHSDFGQVRHAAFCPAVAPNNLMHDVSNMLFMVVWTSHRINLWKADMLSEPVLAVGIHELDIRVARFVGKEPLIVTGSLDKSVRVWRILNKGKRDKGEEEDPTAGQVWDKQISSQGQTEQTDRISVEMLGAARARSFARAVSERVRSRCILHGMHDDSVLNVAGDASARYIASASADRSLAVFDLEHQTDKPLWRGVHMAYVQAVEFSRSGTCLASVGGDRVCRVWSVSTGECTGIFKASGALTKVSFSPCETFVAAGGLAGSLGVWEVATGKPAPGRPHPVMCNFKCSVTSLSWIPGSLGLLVAGTDGEVWAWDVSRGAFIGGFVNKSPANHGDGPPEHFENPGITCAELVVSDKIQVPGSKVAHATAKMKRSPTQARLKRKSTTKRPTDFVLEPTPGTAMLVCGDVRGQVHIVMAPGLETGRASKPSGRHKHFHHHHHTHNVHHDAMVDPLHYLEKRKKSGTIALVLKAALGIHGRLKQTSRAPSDPGSKVESVTEESAAESHRENADETKDADAGGTAPATVSEEDTKAETATVAANAVE